MIAYAFDMDSHLIKNWLAAADDWQAKSAEEILAALMRDGAAQIVQANSLGPEDVVITHMLASIQPSFYSFTLDTGRLNPETYDLLGRLKEKYSLKLEVVFPNNDAVEKMVNEKGINLFYESIENRKLCCQVRKLEPLGRVLSRYQGWICGLRTEQSPTRTQIKKIERDAAHGGILKINPLADWTRDQVWDYIRANNIPYNRLHDKGYPSIGCAPCTRVVKAGEPERAGRWWWENPDTKECGLHANEK